ncbi:hypothetical protein PRZ48_005179 [Zasmidium cellare]|uniref:alpha-1,3-mannosyl-glycoprotein 2-beta-N-acetylglucosaminyltransferase n=1 Tax=Zasmidium cellare TaxID=395010 RepID=A0ABR0ETU9_ZASCE|nr:hypothetical protein PRZ48_005179 [Zasmidium cellare]
MLSSTKIHWAARRRSKSLAGSILLALCVFVVWTWRPIQEWNNVRLPDRTVAKEPEFIEKQRSDEGRSLQKALASSSSADAGNPIIPVVVFAFNRGDHLRRTIDSILSSASFSTPLHPIFISQDGDDPEVTDVIQSYGQKVHHLRYHWSGKRPAKVQLPPEYGLPPDAELPPAYQPPSITPYLKIAGHYEFALAEIMDRVEGHERWDRIIMLEDDMDVSPDFFSYFRKMSPLFDTDPSLYCVSAWNDHGQTPFVSDSTALYRTDCFPGLGWMWSRERWNALRGWTLGWWDDWLREPAQRKGRSCVYPEVSRVYTFGAEGTSSGWFFAPWLVGMRLNEEDVDWHGVDVGYLHRDAYDSLLGDLLRSAVRAGDVVTAKKDIERDLAGRMDKSTEVAERLVEYSDLADLTILMMTVGLLYEHKADVPRSSYQGVLHFRHLGVRIWIVPESFDKGLD